MCLILRGMKVKGSECILLPSGNKIANWRKEKSNSVEKSLLILICFKIIDFSLKQ